MKKGRMTISLATSLFLFIGGIGWLILGLQFPLDSSVTSIGGPGTFPVFVTSVLVVLSGILSVSEFIKSSSAKPSGMEKRDITNILLMILACTLYVALIDLIGYIIATALLLAALLWLFGVRNKVAFVALSVVFPLALYGLFKGLLMIQLP